MVNKKTIAGVQLEAWTKVNKSVKFQFCYINALASYKSLLYWRKYYHFTLVVLKNFFSPNFCQLSTTCCHIF